MQNKASINSYEKLLDESFDEKFYIVIDDLYTRRKKLISEVLSANKELDALLNPSYSAFSDFVGSIQKNSSVVSYNLGTNKSKVTISTSNAVHVLNIDANENYILSKIRKLRKSMKNYSEPFAFEVAAELYTILIEPIENLLTNKDTIYIYGSDLIDLPLGVLLSNYSDLIELDSNYEKLTKANWLIKDYSFARIFPVNNKIINSTFEKKFLGFANPSSINILGLDPLPNTESEIRDLALSSKEFSSSFLFTKSDASKNNLKKSLQSSFERIVFATHSLPAYWNGISNQNSLVLADQGGDFLLSPTEIIDLKINSDIVVLSSCNNDKGGSDSLYKAFLVAGSNSVMYSNWELETISAAQITDEVFKSMLFDDAPKHIALQNASIKLMNDYSNRIYAHPGFWGNFSIAYRNL